MKKPSDDLFDLVKNMTVPQKVYFKQYLRNNTSGKINNYIKLFDLINTSKKWNEEEIRKKASLKNFSKTKGYLYNSILESLRHFYNSSSSLITIHNLLIYAEILKSKALFKQSERMLKKAKDISIREDNFEALTEINSLYIRWVRNPIQLNEMEDLVKNRLNFAFENLEKHKNVLQYTNISNQVFYFIRTKGELLRDKEDLAYINKIASSPLLKDEKKAITLSSKKTFNNVNAVLASLKKEFLQAYQYTLNQASLLEISEMEQNEKIKALIRTSYNAVVYSVNSKKWEDSERWLKRIKSIIPASRNVYYSRFQHYLLAELSFCNKKGEIERALSVINRSENELMKNVNRFDKALLCGIYEAISETYFMAGDFHKSLEWLHPVISDKRFHPSEISVSMGKS